MRRHRSLSQTLLCKHQKKCDDTDHSHRHSSANTKRNATTQITPTGTSSANANRTATPQITLTDTSSANANRTAAHIDKSSANIDITATTQITHTDTSFANTNLAAATQITHTDTSSANADGDHSDRLSRPLQMHSRLRRALRRHRKRLRTVANANANATFGEHSLTPRPPNESGTLARHSGKRYVVSSENAKASSERLRNLAASLHPDLRTNHKFSSLQVQKKQNDPKKWWPKCFISEPTCFNWIEKDDGYKTFDPTSPSHRTWA